MSRNEVMNKMKKKQFRNKENKKKEKYGAPMVDNDYTKVKVIETSAVVENLIGDQGQQYEPTKSPYGEYWVKIAKKRSMKSSKYGYMVTEIICPHCGKPIAWNNTTEEYICDYERPYHRYEPKHMDTRRFVVASGGVVNSFSIVYDQNMKNSKKVKQKTYDDFEREQQKERRKHAPYGCGFLNNNGAPCPYICGKYEKLLHHFEKEHGFIPEQTMGDKKSNEQVDVIASIILPTNDKYRQLNTVVACRYCHGDATLHVKRYAYVCKDCGKSMYPPVDHHVLRVLFQEAAEEGRCGICGAAMRLSKDGERFYCARNWSCISTKQSMYRNKKKTSTPSQKKRNITPISLTTIKLRGVLTERTIHWMEQGSENTSETGTEKGNGVKQIAVINCDSYTIVTRRRQEKNVHVLHGKEEFRSATDAYCPQCGHNKAFATLRQMRGSDEPESRFYECVKCGNKWRED